MANNNVPAEVSPKNPLISDKLFVKLEYLTRVVLPAVATLYVAVGALWGLPNVTAVAGTIVAVDAFLGVFLGFAMKAYDSSDAKYDGTVKALPLPDGSVMLSNLELNQNPVNATTLVLKVEEVS